MFTALEYLSLEIYYKKSISSFQSTINNRELSISTPQEINLLLNQSPDLLPVLLSVPRPPSDPVLLFESTRLGVTPRLSTRGGR